jgi:hypothetical protein
MSGQLGVAQGMRDFLGIPFWTLMVLVISASSLIAGVWNTRMFRQRLAAQQIDSQTAARLIRRFTTRVSIAMGIAMFAILLLVFLCASLVNPTLLGQAFLGALVVGASALASYWVGYGVILLLRR